MLLYYKYKKKGENTTNSSSENYSYFVNNGEFFYIGQILRFYDDRKNYVMDVQILKFIKHYHKKNKVPYICVSIQFLDGYKTHKMTYNAEKSLGVFFTEKIL